MARVVISGWEMGSASIGVEGGTSTTGSPTVSSTTVRSGSGSLRISSLSSGTVQRVNYPHSTATQKFARAYLYVHTRPSAQNRIISFWRAGAGSSPGYITLDSGGLLRLFNSGNTQIGSASSALALDTWYRIEIGVDATGGAGASTLQGRIDGVTFATSSTQTLNTPDDFYLGGNLNSEAQTTGDWFFDDIAVNDGAGSFQNTWPGDEKILALYPNAAGDVNTFGTAVGGTAGAANNFTRVNEIPPDDVTSYNASSTLNQEDLFNVTNSGIGASDTVNCVALIMRGSNDVASVAVTIALEIIKASGGTKTSSSSFTTSNQTTWFTNNKGSNIGVAVPRLVTYQDPDGSNWTQSTLDTMQIGYKLTGASGAILMRITTCFAYVGYTPAAGGGGGPGLPDGSLAMTGVGG